MVRVSSATERGPANFSARQPSTMARLRCFVTPPSPPSPALVESSLLIRWRQRTAVSTVGSGQSSSRSVMTAGPRGSLTGMTSTRDWTSCSQPSSWSATLCSFIRLAGGSCSFSTSVLMTSSVSSTSESTVFWSVRTVSSRLCRLISLCARPPEAVMS